MRMRTASRRAPGAAAVAVLTVGALVAGLVAGTPPGRAFAGEAERAESTPLPPAILEEAPPVTTPTPPQPPATPSTPATPHKATGPTAPDAAGRPGVERPAPVPSPLGRSLVPPSN